MVSIAETEGIPYIDIESVKESVLVLSEMENDEDPDEMRWPRRTWRECPAGWTWRVPSR